MAKAYTLSVQSTHMNITCAGFHFSAEDFLQAANAYAPSARQGSFVVHFLCCQSIELSLKAYLSLKGFDRLRMKKVGHNLESLFAKAINNGLKGVVVISPTDHRTLQVATKWYDTPGEKRFQYFSVIDAARGFRDAPEVHGLLDLGTRLQSKKLRDAVLA